MLGGLIGNLLIAVGAFGAICLVLFVYVEIYEIFKKRKQK